MQNARLALLIALVACTMIGCATAPQPVERYAMVIRLKKEKLERYKQLHADPWQGVLEQCDRSHLRNFSIWLVELRPDEFYLFGYFEYDGDDLEADMARMADDAETQRWWKQTDPCQVPIDTAREAEHWVMMEEVFYHDKATPGAPLMPKPSRPAPADPQGGDP